MTDYSRQETLDLNIPETATIVGCGGTGYWTGWLLGMSGTKRLILVDNDRIDKSNLNRIPQTMESIGNYKITALADTMGALRKEIVCEKHFMKIRTEQDCQILRGSVFCCTDNLRSQQMILAYCRKNKLPYQRIGYDGLTLNVSKAFPLSFKEEAENEGGYTITPSWVIPAVVAAALGVFSRCKSEIQIMDEIGKLGIINSSYIPEKIKERIENEHLERSCHTCNNGDCDDCDRGDCNTCDHGDCSICNRGDCRNCDELGEEYNRGYAKGHSDGYKEKEEEENNE